MQKDFTIDYTTAAFRYYASLGKPSYRSLKAKYTAEALEAYSREHEKGTGIGKPTEAAAIYAEKEVEKKIAELNDILAVEKIYNSVTEGVREIIEIVYFTDANKPLRRGDISNRVCKASVNTYTSIKGIYRILKSVRIAFAEERGLRT